jgi:hypothetical protein
LVAVGFAWALWQMLAVENLLFCLIGFGLALWSLNAVGKRVVVSTKGICVVQHYRLTRCVDYRQLVNVAEEGRINPVITLVYHPAQDDGLLDLDAAASMELPAVRSQAELLSLLQARTPQ